MKTAPAKKHAGDLGWRPAPAGAAGLGRTAGTKWDGHDSTRLQAGGRSGATVSHLGLGWEGGRAPTGVRNGLRRAAGWLTGGVTGTGLGPGGLGTRIGREPRCPWAGSGGQGRPHVAGRPFGARLPRSGNLGATHQPRKKNARGMGGVILFFVGSPGGCFLLESPGGVDPEGGGGSFVVRALARWKTRGGGPVQRCAG